MALNRKDFLKTACLSGACFCGFTSVVQATGSKTEIKNSESEDPNKKLMQNWISTLLHNIDKVENDATCRKIMKACARSHYTHLNMDEVLKPYEGELEQFNGYIAKEWGWKIDYNREEDLLIVDENKNYCVCPMVHPNEGSKSSILCYCSEGFAELMYSKVVGHPVHATVISSVIRGDASCQYKIKLS
jgi:hypothetical protein